MTDIASLGIKVTTDGVQQANQQLEKLTKSGNSAADAAKNVDRAWANTTFGPQKLLAANESLRKYRQELQQSADAGKRLASEAAQNATAMARENGVRERLSTLLATTRGQRILEAEAARKSNSLLGTTATGYANAAMSAKALQAAQRQLPMQFTDIFTGLASGQRPLQVLLQQGGQLKDVFGGIGPALRASAGYIMGLVNPLTLAAGAAVALGAAYFKGAQESVEFNKALILTGNYADTTAESLADVAAQMDDIAGVTTKSAAAALAEVASTGRFTAEQITLVATAAENMRVGTGKAVQDTVREFLRLREDPVRAVLQLNDTYHFLTRSTYDQIKALQEQGREADAATVAIEAYAGAINSRIPQITENLGWLEKAWKGIKTTASEAWDEMLGIGRKTTPTDLRGDIDMWRADMARNPRMSGVEREMREKQIRDAQAEIQRLSRPKVQVIDGSAATAGIAPPTRTVDSARIRAEDEFQKQTLRFLSQRQQLENDIAEIRKAGVKAGKSEAEIEKQIGQVRAYYANKGPKTKKTTTDLSASILQQARQQIAVNEEQLRSEDKLTASQRLRARLMEQVEILGPKLNATQRKAIEQELEQLRTSGELAEKWEKERQVKESLVRLNERINDQEANRLRSNQVDLLGIGRGGDEVERQRRALDIEYQYQDDLRQLHKQAALERRDVSKEEEQALRDSRDRMLRMEEGYYAERDRMQADWKNGAVRALEDYMAAADDVASRTADAISGVLGSMQGMFEEFFKTGKLDWKGFLDDINAELARFFSQQLVKQIIGAFGGGQTAGTQSSGSGSGEGWGAIATQLFSAYFGGGRATGGPVKAGRFYEVGERGPELLRTNGRNFLIPGRDGVVQPNMGGGQRAGVTMQVTNTFSERVDRRSRSAVESSMYRATTRAQGRR